MTFSGQRSTLVVGKISYFYMAERGRPMRCNSKSDVGRGVFVRFLTKVRLEYFVINRNE